MKPDYKAKTCYEDQSGNTVDPKTTWDDLLKYYRRYHRLLGVGQYSRDSSSNTPLKALKLIIAERIYRENVKQASKKESQDLKRKENKRRKNRRERTAKLAADYLDKVHKQHS